MISMKVLKSLLAAFGNERGWKDGDALGTTAIYSLVGKTVLRIDRRGKEGPLVGIRY